MSFTLPNSDLLLPVSGDGEIGGLFAAEADLKAMLAFESALAAVQADAGLLPRTSARAIAVAAAEIAVDPRAISEEINRDGLAVPALVDVLRKQLAQEVRPHLHLGTTSQDLIDTSLMLRAKAAMAIVMRRLEQIAELLQALHAQFGSRPLIGRTRMQRALPITVGDRVQSWLDSVRQAGKCAAALDFPVQLGGPVGTISFPGVDIEALRANLASRLGLSPSTPWHSMRMPVMRIGEACCAVSGCLGKLGADITLMAQNEAGEARLSGTGSSSAMPHKQNPVKAEILIALARFNASQLGCLHQAMVHENERSGAAWTLEWLVLPQMVLTAGASTRVALELVHSVEALGG
jgi:3-carboxy-cis,cis-muconate cycloisomerase